MKAVRIHDYGGAEVLKYEEIPAPQIGADEVLLRVAATAVNPIDAKIRAGLMRHELPRPLPFALGWDGAGVVERVGARAAHFKPGDEVFTMPGFDAGGTYAEFVAVKESQVALKPRSLSPVEAAALPMTAGAAWTALVKTADLQPGQRVLIHGAAGGVGSMAVQIAKWRGAYVVATASGGGVEAARSLGADEVTDYRERDFSAAVKGVDVVLDVVGGATEEKSWPTLKPGGVLLATARPPDHARAATFGVRCAFVFTKPDRQMLDRLAALVDAGKLRPRVGRELTLSDARAAHELMQAGGVGGKIILRPNLS